MAEDAVISGVIETEGEPEITDVLEGSLDDVELEHISATETEYQTTIEDLEEEVDQEIDIEIIHVIPHEEDDGNPEHTEVIEDVSPGDDIEHDIDLTNYKRPSEEIENWEDLFNIRYCLEYPEGHDEAGELVEYVQVSDLDLSEAEVPQYHPFEEASDHYVDVVENGDEGFLPIRNYYFDDDDMMMHYDGQGHEITGLFFPEPLEDGEKPGTGIWGNVPGQYKNMNIDYDQPDYVLGDNAAIVAGEAQGGDYQEFINVNVDAKVKFSSGFAQSGVGVLAGYSNAEILEVKDCEINIEAEGAPDETGGCIGPFAGGELYVEDTTVKGKMENTNASFVGGIVGGGWHWEGGHIKNCVAELDLFDVEDSSGGIVAFNFCEIIDCSFKGTITSDSGEFIGGIVGQDFENEYKISGCEAEVDITVDGVAEYVGGIAGEQQQNVPTEDCKVEGSITTEECEYVGGVVGATSGDVINCTFKGTVDNGAEQYTGGILGGNEGGLVEGCFVEGEVTSEDSFTGGIAGFADDGTVKKCGVITEGITGVDAGGIDGGTQADVDFEDCFVIGDIEADERAGGISVYASGEGLIRNCYFAGDLNSPELEDNGEEYSTANPGIVVASDDPDNDNYDYENVYYNEELIENEDLLQNTINSQPRTTDEMTKRYAYDTFENWDFAEVWVEISPEKGYPALKGMGIEITEAPEMDLQTKEMLLHPKSGSPVTELSSVLTPEDDVVAVEDISKLPPPPSAATIIYDEEYETLVYERKDEDAGELRGVTRRVEGSGFAEDQNWPAGMKITRVFTAEDHMRLIKLLREFEFVIKEGIDWRGVSLARMGKLPLQHEAELDASASLSATGTVESGE